MAKKTAYMGMLTALAFVFSYIESLLPIHLGVPGIKLGLANLVVMVALYTMSIKAAFTLSIVRIILTAFTFGNLSAVIYSFAGGMLSLAIMILAKKLDFFSVTGVSVLGGVFHNLGQIIAAVFVAETVSLLYYLPVLILSGTVAGVFIGIISSILIRYLKSYVNERWD
ncbi:MAG: Gx transporter family protein [Lachnospiraceae bacterium]|nr:Gx transporter family protein [Lachnospiraceae bacterium]